MNRNEVLNTAKEIINGDRQDDYGDARDSFASIGAYWTNYLKHPITAKDVAMMMVLLKVSRMSTGSGSNDCLIDMAGYSALAAEMLDTPQKATQCSSASFDSYWEELYDEQ